MEKIYESKGEVSDDGKSITFKGLPIQDSEFNYHYVLEFQDGFTAKGADCKLVFNKEK